MLSRYLYRAAFAHRWQYRSSGVVGDTIRQYSAVAETKHDVSCEELALKWQQARPYSEIPGPSKLQFLRDNLPGGSCYNQSYTTILTTLRRQYGNIYRIPGLFGMRENVLSLNPDDFPIIARNEGTWPQRQIFDSIIHHREVVRGEFFQGVHGLVVSNGEKWGKMRSIVNPILMQPKNARLYLNTMLEVNNEFMQRIREIRDPETLEMPDTFVEEIHRLTLETAVAVALNTQLGLIRKNRDTEECQTILKTLNSLLDLAYDLDFLPSIWKYVKTPKYKRMMHTLDVLADFGAKCIDDAIAKIEKDADGKLSTELGQERSLLEKLLRHDRRIATVMAIDFMLGGVETTTTSLTGILLCLAKNVEKQQKLRKEIQRVLPHKDSLLTLDNMKNLPYLRACIKEGIRLYPLTPGLLRALPVDVVLSGYRVPKDTNITVASNLLLRDEQYVTKPNEFLPERWLRNDENRRAAETIDPFVYQPFGFGPRSCVGKRIVELELEITIARLVRNFNIEFNYSIENAFKSRLINVPAIPLKFKFEEISD